jgi:phosphatidylglycerophosphatase A
MNKPEKIKVTYIPFGDKLIATVFFSGYSPFAPGTAGSLVALLIYLIPGFENSFVLVPLVVLFFFTGVYTSSHVEKIIGHDPSIVVIDEMVGMWISLLFLPKTWIVCIAAFLLFRIFDIFKPPPARQFEHFRGGWGIMLDDIVAGIYANVSTQLFLFLFNILSR